MSTMQIVFSVIGLLLIGLIIGHGMWNIRRNERRAREQQLELERKRQQRQPSAAFDDDGIGEVRVIKRASERVSERDSKQQAAKPKPPVQPEAKTSRPATKAGAESTEKSSDDARSAPTEPDSDSNPDPILKRHAAPLDDPISDPIRAMQDDEELELPSLAAEPDELKKAQQKTETKSKAKAQPQPTAAAKKTTAAEPTQQSMELPLEPDDELIADASSGSGHCVACDGHYHRSGTVTADD